MAGRAAGTVAPPPAAATRAPPCNTARRATPSSFPASLPGVARPRPTRARAPRYWGCRKQIPLLLRATGRKTPCPATGATGPDNCLDPPTPANARAPPTERDSPYQSTRSRAKWQCHSAPIDRVTDPCCSIDREKVWAEPRQTDWCLARPRRAGPVQVDRHRVSAEPLPSMRTEKPPQEYLLTDGLRCFLPYPRGRVTKATPPPPGKTIPSNKKNDGADA